MAFFRNTTTLAINQTGTGDVSYQPPTNGNMVAAPGARTVFHDNDYNAPNNDRTVNVQINNHGTTTPTFSIQPKQSLDGVTYYNLGSAIAAAGLTVLSPTMPILKLNVGSISGGGLDIIAG